ncbi:MAG: alpha/beta hydrolase [Bacteroidota bacterium]
MPSKLVSLFFLLLLSCGSAETKEPLISDQEAHEQALMEGLYLDLGGEPQYVEILGQSEKNPVLLFIHGGPGWPQTPQFRYYNLDIAKDFTVVLWEQRGAGQSYLNNPQPENLSLAQIVSDGHELTQWLQKKFRTKKIYLAGYSWGSIVGTILADKYPDDYLAYIGIAQLINMDKGMALSRNWLTVQAKRAGKRQLQRSIDSLRNPANYPDQLSRFYRQYQLLNEFNGAIFNKLSEARTQRAMNKYSDYQGYDWLEVWSASASALQEDMFGINLSKVDSLDVPVYLLQGRHDWNIPSVLAAEWLDKLSAPTKQLVWFEKSGHGPLEEEPEEFNAAIRALLE